MDGADFLAVGVENVAEKVGTAALAHALKNYLAAKVGFSIGVANYCGYFS